MEIVDKRRGPETRLLRDLDVGDVFHHPDTRVMYRLLSKKRGLAGHILASAPDDAVLVWHIGDGRFQWYSRDGKAVPVKAKMVIE